MKRTLAVWLLLPLALSAVFLFSQSRQHVATLATDVYEGKTLLSVDWIGSATIDRMLMIESRDGADSDTYEVKHVYGTDIILKQRLKSDYAAGSKIYQ